MNTETSSRPTAPLPAAATQAIRRLDLALIPPLMEFPTGSGATVTVHAVDSERTPYLWQCSAGHSGGHSYASLPFCRDDAEAHAAKCEGLPGVAAGYKSAETRANELIQAARETGRMSDLNADDLAHNVDLMAGYRATLVKAHRLDLIEAVR